MSVRIALYAEGPLDSGDEWPWTTPGNELQPDELGPAHRLVRRAVRRVRRCPEEAVRFHAPLRRGDGHHLRGSDLRTERNLRRILAGHALDAQAVDRIVVLVDEDADDQRDAAILAIVGDRAALGVPVRELESWLVADARALADLGLQPPGPPETLPPGAAKQLLGPAPQGARATLAASCDLDEVASVCRSFRRFLERLA